MGLADVKNFRRRTGLDEFGEDLAPPEVWVLDLAVELAVGKGAGAAFAELDIGLRIELALAPQAESVLGAFAHRLAALQDDRTEAHLRQDQGGKQPAGTAADHDRS